METLEEFGIAPGRARENITTRGIALGTLSLGQRLRVGEALLEVTKPCTPCHQMDEIRQGLQEAIRGRRGLLCRVVEPGRIRRGDRVEVEEKAQRAAYAAATIPYPTRIEFLLKTHHTNQGGRESFMASESKNSSASRSSESSWGRTRICR